MFQNWARSACYRCKTRVSRIKTSTCGLCRISKHVSSARKSLTGHMKGRDMLKDMVSTFDWASTPLGEIATWPQALRTTVEVMMAAQAQIVIFAGDSLLAIYNDAYAPTIGSKHPHAFGRPAAEGWHELWDDLGPLLIHVRDTGETIAAQDRPFTIDRHGYPEEVFFDISFSAIRDGDGSVCGVLCIVAETTARVLGEKALTQSEEQLRTLLGQAQVGIVVADPDRNLRLANAHFTAMTGYTAADLAGRRIEDFLLPPRVPTGDGVEERLRCKDGRVIWVAHAEGPIRNSAGAVSQIGIIFADITARRAQEADLRRMAAIIASSDDAILSTDLDMRITSWNDGATRLYGYTADEMIGRSVLTLVPPDRQWEEQRILARIRTGGRVRSHETLRCHRDGSLIDVSLTVSPVIDDCGVVIGASKIARNIADRRRAEKMQKVLVEEMKHRVKNILATVHAIARQTFAHQQSPQTEAFESRLFALSRAQDLITRDSRDGAGLEQVIRDVLAPYQATRVTVTGPAIQLSARAALSVTLGLHELATNAAKYGALSTEGGRVAISWQVTQGDPAQFSLTWQETGGPPVMPPARRGFGTSLVSVVVPAELGGTGKLDYAPDGLVWRVEAPMGDWGELVVPREPEPVAGLLTDEV